jgi:iron complex outermembrane receptor protein
MTNRRLLNSPEHLGKLNVSVPLYQDKVYAGFELQYSSAVDNIRRVSTDGYVLANFTLFSRELVKGWEASASVYNLFNEDYGYPGGPEHLQDTVQQNGRNFRVKLTYRF